MAAPVFQAVVTTADRSSPALQAITRKIEGMSAAAARAEVATTRMALRPVGALQALHGHLGNVAGAFGRVRGAIGGVISGITSLMPPLAALGGAGSLAGLFGMVKKVADAREETRHMAETIGILPSQLGKMNYAARMSGTNVEAMHTGMTRLNRVMALAAAGKNKDALALFQKMGVSMEELRTGNAATILPKIAGAFQATENAALRTRMAFALFGRGGADMIAMLARGPEAMRQWGDEAARFGYKFTQVDDENLTSFRESWIRLETAVGGFINMLGARLAPDIGPVVEQFANWVVVNRDWISTQITEKVGEFVGWLQGVDWPAVGREILEWTRAARDFIEAIGGVKVALGAVILISFSPMLVAIGEVIAAVGRLAIAIGTTLVGAFKLAGDAAAAFNARTMALPVFRMMALAMNVWDTARQGTPITQQDVERMSDADRQRFGLTRGPSGQWQYRNQQTGEMVTPPASRFSEPGRPDQPPAPRTNILGGKPWGDWLWEHTFGSPPPGAVPTAPPGAVPPRPQEGVTPGALPGERRQEGEEVAPTINFPPLPGDRSGGGLGPLQIFPNLYAPAAAPGAPGQQGAVDVNVKFANAPPGTQIDVQSTGQVRAPQPEVGYAFGFERAAFA